MCFLPSRDLKYYLTPIVYYLKAPLNYLSIFSQNKILMKPTTCKLFHQAICTNLGGNDYVHR